MRELGLEPCIMLEPLSDYPQLATELNVPVRSLLSNCFGGF